MNKQDLVAVVLGGPSTEAAVSRVTGGAIAQALREKGYNAQEVELVPDKIIPTLLDMHAKVVFNAVHGKYGEDGRLQSLLEAAGILYTGSGLLASAVSMDKVATKRFLQSENISTPRFRIINRKQHNNLPALKQEILQEFGVPVVIKAASQGSSLGVYIVKKEEDIEAAITGCFEYCYDVLIEECIIGKELTVAMMEEDGEPIALPIIWIDPHSGSYDYHSKYTKGATEYHCPAPLPEEVTKQVQDLAVATYRVLGLKGVARVDVMLSEDNIGYVLEANTVPGMTATSLVPKAAATMGIPFPDLCEKILLNAKKGR